MSANWGEAEEVPRAVGAGAPALGGETPGVGLGQPGAGKAWEGLGEATLPVGSGWRGQGRVLHRGAWWGRNRQYM